MGTEPGSSRGARALPYVVVALLALVPFAEALVPGRVLCFRDLAGWFHPVLSQAWPQSHDLMPPLWIHGIACGRPLWDNPGWALAAPLNLLLKPLPFDLAFDAFLMLHAMLAGAAMTWLARVLGASRIASVVAGATYVLGGGVVSATALYWTLVALAWAPLVIGCALRAVERPSRRRFGLLALTLAGQALGGQPEPILATLALGAVLTLVRGEGSVRMRARRSLLAWAACGAWALLIASPLLLPAAQFARSTLRGGGFGIDGILYNSLDPRLLAGLVLRRWGGHPMDRHVGGYPAGAWTDTGTPYFHALDLGLVAVLLAVAALMIARPRSLSIALAAMAGLGVVVALGRFLPGAEALVGQLAPLPLRYPIKALALTHLAVPLLAALGTDALARRWPRVRLALPILVALELTYAQHRMLPACDASVFGEPPLARELKERAARLGVLEGQWRVHHERLPRPWLAPAGSLEPTEEAAIAWETRMLLPPRGAPFGIHHALEGLNDAMDDRRWVLFALDLYGKPRREWAEGLGSAGVLFVVSPHRDLEDATARALVLETALGSAQGLPEGSGYLYRCAAWQPRIRVLARESDEVVGAVRRITETPYGFQAWIQADVDGRMVVADALGDLSAWTGRVDAERAPLGRTGPRGAFVELPVPAAAHDVRLLAFRPLLPTAACLVVAGAALLAAFYAVIGAIPSRVSSP